MVSALAAAGLLFVIPPKAHCQNKTAVKLQLPTKMVYGGLPSAAETTEKKAPRLGLALSGGGAKAAASIGVLKVLTENGIPVSAVAGTSMGALIGGLYAAGYHPDEIEKIFLSTDWNTLFTDTPVRALLTQEQKEEKSRHLLEFAFTRGRFITPQGLSAGQKLFTLLAAKTLAASFWSDLDFNRLRIPFRAVATDIETGEKVVLDHGLIHEAVRASIAIPLVFQPVQLDGKVLVDGGLVDNLPVDVARSMNADIVIAVDSSAKLEKRDKLTSMFEVINQAVAIEVQQKTLEQTARADFAIFPDTSAFSFTDFPRIQEIIRKGEEAARAALPRIRELMNSTAGTASGERRYSIKSLVVRGNVAVPEDTIRYTMATSLPARQASTDDLRAAMVGVFHLGFFSEISLELDQVGSHDRAVLTVSENPVVKEITISGAHMISREEIEKELNGQVGITLNVTKVTEALDRIVERYRKKGYLLVHVVNAEMKPENGILEITLFEGRVDFVNITGQKKTQYSLIQREIRTRVGDPLNVDTLERDIQRLYALDYFESLSVDLAKSPFGGITMTLKIKEKVTNRVRLGFRYDLEDSFTGLTDIVIDNLTGRGFKLYLNTRYGNYLDLTLGYHSPVFLRSYFGHTIETFYRQRTYYIYENRHKISELDIRRIGGDISFGYQWFRFGDTYLRYRYEADETSQVLGLTTPEQDTHIGSMAFLTTIDTRDSNTFPHTGVLFKGSYENAQRAYGSTSEFVKTAAFLQGNIPFGQRHTVMLEGTIGIGSGTIPYQEKYGIGGADYLLAFPLLGYQRREFTGSELLGFTLAYRIKVLEYQLKAVRAIYLSLTGQAANVWEKRSELSIRDLRTGGGLGLHADTLIGPIRLDFGAGEDRHRAIYLSMGFEF